VLTLAMDLNVYAQVVSYLGGMFQKYIDEGRISVERLDERQPTAGPSANR
jgi:hypothetical protein